MTNPFQTFSETKKAEVLAIAKEHREADRFIQGAWLQSTEPEEETQRGCFYGCMTQTEENTLEEAHRTLEMPLWLIHISEKIYEGLPPEQAIEFPVQLIEAIPEDTDTTQIWKNWNIALLTDQLRFVDAGSEQEKAIMEVIYLFQQEEISLAAAGSAAKSAYFMAGHDSFALSAAGHAARSAHFYAKSDKSADESAYCAAGAAWHAAKSAYCAAGAAWHAAKSAWCAWRAAKSIYCTWMRDTLIDVLKR